MDATNSHSEISGPVILGIESSCDETAAAIVCGDGTILANVVASQAEMHAQHGGVVPEVAARSHLDAIGPVIRRALNTANMSADALDGIAATGGPGLIGGVLVGTMTAKTMASALGKPYYAINHLEGHALTPRLTDKVAFPYLLLLISGGHTQLLAVHGLGKYERYGTTLDDAAGEAFDKGAKLLGLGYPGGPVIEAAAETGNPKAIALPHPRSQYHDCHFSFSGLKTALAQKIEKARNEMGDNICVADFAASLQLAVSRALLRRTEIAMQKFADATGVRRLVIAGGVAANKLIGSGLREAAAKHNFSLAIPPAALCTDNAAMIAWAGCEYHAENQPSSLDFAPRPRWPLDPDAPPPPGRGVRQ